MKVKIEVSRIDDTHLGEFKAVVKGITTSTAYEVGIGYGDNSDIAVRNAKASFKRNVDINNSKKTWEEEL